MKEERNSKTDIAKSSGKKKAEYRKPEMKAFGKVTATTLGSTDGFAESGQDLTFFQLD